MIDTGDFLVRGLIGLGIFSLVALVMVWLFSDDDDDDGDWPYYGDEAWG